MTNIINVLPWTLYLHQLRAFFQSEIVSLLKTFSTAQLTSIENLSPPQGGTSPDMTQLLKENHDLQRRPREIESKNENLKAEAKIISDENKSLVTALIC